MASETRPNEPFIAVIGVTGSGKSTFIQQFTESEVTIGHTLSSWTREIEMFPCTLPNGTKFYLLDTPGFDDNRYDVEILREIRHFLFEPGILLAGIIYLHPISQIRILSSPLKARRILRVLCGGDSTLASVVLATTMWDMVDSKPAERRENELVNDPLFWKPMLEHGSKVFRLDKSQESAVPIIQYLVGLSGTKS